MAQHILLSQNVQFSRKDQSNEQQSAKLVYIPISDLERFQLNAISGVRIILLHRKHSTTAKVFTFVKGDGPFDLVTTMFHWAQQAQPRPTDPFLSFRDNSGGCQALDYRAINLFIKAVATAATPTNTTTIGTNNRLAS
jgi:hypothetical protein